MIRAAPTLAFVLCAAMPLGAETVPPAPPASDTDKGFSLIEEGAKIIMRSLLDQMEPALDEMQKDLGTAMEEFGPVLKDLAAMIGDMRNYHAPVKLPNGDILIRRKTPGELALPQPGAEIEL